jgi:hypothetical protein
MYKFLNKMNKKYNILLKMGNLYIIGYRIFGESTCIKLATFHEKDKRISLLKVATL